MAFYVGQKVVCVDDKPRNWPTCKVKAGQIYTVRGMAILKFWGPVVFLEEVEANQPSSGFIPDRFRPIVEKKTDISIFTAMLTPKQINEKPTEKIA